MSLARLRVRPSRWQHRARPSDPTADQLRDAGAGRPRRDQARFPEPGERVRVAAAEPAGPNPRRLVGGRPLWPYADPSQKHYFPISADTTCDVAVIGAGV